MFNEDWYPSAQCLKIQKLVRSVSMLDGDIIENGCWEGKSTISLANACYPSILICNDTWLGNVGESNITGITHPTEIIVKHRDVYSIFLENMNNNTQKNFSVVKMDVIEWLQTYTNPIKFIHIDASHDYESVYETIRLAMPRMVKGGIMCGDDIASANINRSDLHGGVERAVNELLPGFKSEGNLWYWTNN